MKSYQYKIKAYLNATHSIYIEGIAGQRHPHTWEMIVTVINGAGNDFLPFHEVEEVLEDMLKPYQDKYLNEVQPFVTINPTLENICEKFKEKLVKLFHPRDWILLKIELSETPTRSYFIDLVEELNEFSIMTSNTAYTKEIHEEALKLIKEFTSKVNR